MIDLFFHAIKTSKFDLEVGPRADKKHYQELHSFELPTQTQVDQYKEGHLRTLSCQFFLWLRKTRHEIQIVFSLVLWISNQSTCTSIIFYASLELESFNINYIFSMPWIFLELSWMNNSTPLSFSRCIMFWVIDNYLWNVVENIDKFFFFVWENQFWSH